MLIAASLKGMLEARERLQTSEGVSLPSFISEHTQRLAQYTGAVEEHLADLEAELVEKTSDQFKAFLDSGKSANASGEMLKYEFKKERAEIVKLTRLCNSSWKIISVSQSRVKHLIAEATNLF